MITTPQARAVATALLGRAPSGCQRFRPPAGGADSTTFRLRLGADRMLLTVKRRPGSPVGIRFHALLRAAGLPVPELIAFGPAAGPEGEACAIWEWVEGVPAEWGPGEPCPYDEAEFGELLGRIHGLGFEGDYGFLGDDLEHRAHTLPGLGPVSSDWASFFHCDVAAERYLALGYLDAEEAGLLSSLPRRLGEGFASRPRRLLHMGDVMHTGNMLIDRRSGRIRAILDYTESMVGDPLWELAWIRYYFADYPWDRQGFDLARFWAGYGAEHGSEDLLGRFYLMAVLLFEKLRFYEPDSPRGRWAVATVRRLLRTLA
ncbi:MAG TPA: aminoglycoside phosphotransferase family protein [Candidatus Dormibacteraeota bacterium]|nr:aminoglycoside phosphotransferase family protein [Candidatus Dormibacteraeota bacterium]